jgi:hypothetical protein
LSFNIQAQNLQYTFVNKDSLNAINHVAKINGKLAYPIFNGNWYFINIEFGDTLSLIFQDYQTEKYILNQKDNFVKEFNLTQKLQELQEVNVFAEKFRKIAGEKNESIIDYAVLPNQKAFMYLRKHKNKYTLVLETDFANNERTLNFKPESFFLDCMGNFHIVNKDSVHQLWITDSIKIISTITRKLFDTNLANLIAKTDFFLFKEEILNHNKMYELKMYNKIIKDTLIYCSFDKIAYKVARSNYNQIIGYYYYIVPEIENIIEAGIWDGNLIKLAYGDTLPYMISWYLSNRALPIPCYSFGMMDDIVILNLFEDKLIKYDYNGHLKEKKDLNTKNMNNKQIIYDYFYNNLFIESRENVKREIFKIDLESGLTSRIGVFDGMDISNIKISGNEIFFLYRNEAGFNKLYKTQFVN